MAALADELAQLADLVMLTRESGIPADALARLAELAALLSAIDAGDPERSRRLHRAAADLGEAVEAMMRGEPSASEHFHRRAKGLAKFLARENMRSCR